MTQRDRLLARILARPPEASFSDVYRVLEAFGWVLARRKGAHVHFTKRGERTITVPLISGRKVKRTYLNMIIERLGLDG